MGGIEMTSWPSETNQLLSTILLSAHAGQVPNLLNMARQHSNILRRYWLLAPPNIAHQLERESHLSVHPIDLDRLESEIETSNLLAVIFLVNPTQSTASTPDVANISRLCIVRNIPFAFNLATAYPIISSFLQTRVAHLIFNPVAGQRDSTQDLLNIRQCLSPWMHLHIHFTSREEDADRLTQKAIASKPDLIVASGGDGTVSLVCSQMVDTGIPLGIIPRGTANALSVALGIPTTVMGACQLILAGTTRRLDVAYCNQTLMTLLAGIGLEAGTVGKATRQLKNQWGVLAYLIAGWEQLGEQDLFSARVEIGDRVHQFQAVAVTVANAAPPTSVLAQGVGEVIFDDGLLDITIVTKKDAQQPTFKSKLQAARDLMNLYGSALLHTQAELPNLYHFRAERLTLSTASPEQIVVDGEMVGNTPLDVRCLPSALTVVAPPKRRPTSLEKIARFWVQNVYPSVTALIAALGLGGLIGLPVAFWMVRRVATDILPAQTEAVEIQLLRTIQQLSNPFLDRLMLFISSLATLEAIVPFVLITLGLLWWKRDYWKVLLILLVFVGAGTIEYELTFLLDYSRPDIQPPSLIDQVSDIARESFLQGTVLYGTFAYLLTLRFPRFSRWFYGGAALLVGSIGFSRLYLGIQWPFDVLAGLSSGLLWTIVCIALLRLQDIRRAAKQQKKKVSKSALNRDRTQ